MEIKTTPINCVLCARSFLEEFDGAVGGNDPVVDRIADMAKTALAALFVAASTSREVSLSERGMTAEVTLTGCDERKAG